MPENKFRLEKNGPERLKISWKGLWKDVTITFDNEVVGVIPDQKALKEGAEFTLHDGSVLKVKLKTGFGNAGLDITINDKPVSGSVGDPKTNVKVAYGVLYFITVVNIVLGIIAEIGKVTILLSTGIGFGTVVLGAIYGILAFLVHKKESVIALIIAIILFTVDAVLSLYFSISSGGQPGTGGIVLKVFLIIAMIQGVKALLKLKKKQSENRE